MTLAAVEVQVETHQRRRRCQHRTRSQRAYRPSWARCRQWRSCCTCLPKRGQQARGRQEAETHSRCIAGSGKEWGTRHLRLRMLCRHRVGSASNPSAPKRVGLTRQRLRMSCPFRRRRMPGSPCCRSGTRLRRTLHTPRCCTILQAHLISASPRSGSDNGTHRSHSRRRRCTWPWRTRSS